MTDEYIGRRTTLKVLGGAGVAALASSGLGAAIHSDDGEYRYEEDRIGRICDLFDEADEPSNVKIADANLDGHVVGRAKFDDVPRGFAWSPEDGFYERLAKTIWPTAINDQGAIAGYWDDEAYNQAFIRFPDGEEVFLPGLEAPPDAPEHYDPYQAYGYEPIAINASNQVIGVAKNSDERLLVKWTAGSGTGGGDGSDGDSGSDDDSSDPEPTAHSLRIEGTDEASFAHYELVIDGTAEPGELANSSESVTENDDGTVTLSGTIGSGTDSFTFTGSLVSAEDVAGARYVVDGEEYVPGGGSDGDDSDSSDGDDSDSTDGDDSDSSDGDDSDSTDGDDSDSSDEDDSDSSDGDDSDSSDEDDSDSSDGDDSDSSDGDGSGDQTESVLRIYGTDEANFANYEVYIDGTATTRGSANSGDVVVENDDGTVTAAGTVGGGVDDYAFTGEITGWNEAAGARLTVDGEEWSGGG